MSGIEFSEMVIEMRNPMKAFALNLTRNTEDALDLVQETYYKAFYNRDKFQAGTNIKAWLLTIMKNIFINNYRRAAKRNIVHDDSDNQFVLNNTSHEIANTAEGDFVMRDLEAAVDHLTEDYRKPFVMHYEGFKYEEIASEINLPLGTVKSRIFFARKHMQAFLSAHGFERY